MANENDNDLKAIESAIQNARPATSSDLQARIAYEAGFRAGSHNHLSLRPAVSSLPWKIVSLALAGCLLFLIVNSNGVTNNNQPDPKNQIVENESSEEKGQALVELDTFHSPGQTTVDWRSYSDTPDNIFDFDSQVDRENSGPLLRPTNVNSLIDSI